MKKKGPKKVLLIILAVAFLLGGGYGAYRYYRSARQTRLVRQAQQYLAKPDLRRAGLCLQRALRYKPKDVAACRLMAELSAKLHSPAALLWRSRVVEFNPHSLDDRLALADTAVSLHDYIIATNALAGVSSVDKKTAAYHNVAGTVAATAGLNAQAESNFLEAIRLEPTNVASQLNLAVVRLHGTNATSLVEARRALNRIISTSTNSALRSQAIRELAIDALRFRDEYAAMAFSQELLDQTNSSFTDKLLRLDVLQQSRSAEFAPSLAACKREAAGDPGHVYELALWQSTKISTPQALTWLRTLLPAMQTNQSVAMLTAECQISVSDWRGLHAFLQHQYWGDMEFLRHAFTTRALRGEDLATAAQAEWELTIKAANSRKESLTMLLRLAAQWKWNSESEDLLWNIVNHYPDEKWAEQLLAQILYAGGRTRSLMELFHQNSKLNPSDLDNMNNLAMTALLLDAQELKPRELARTAYEKAPTNASYAATYAFSLYLEKKDGEALKVMKKLKPDVLRRPDVSGYYGVFLLAAGDRKEAKKYLDLSAKAPLLPEERKIFEKASAGT